MSKVWTNEKLNLLKDYLREGLTVPEIADKLNSTYDAVKNAMNRYKLRNLPTTNSNNPVIDIEELTDTNFEILKQQAKLQWRVQQHQK
jgi:predicted DNA-binding protein YlxM (UPF0122 family)